MKTALPRSPARTALADGAFYAIFATIGLTYLALILLLIVADSAYMLTHSSDGNPIMKALQSPEIRNSIWLTLLSCKISAIISVWIAVPVGYLLTRVRFPGSNLVDALLDIPIVLPPLDTNACRGAGLELR